MEKNQIITVEIEDMSSEGSGIGHFEGMAVFVNGTVPGDVVTARAEKVKKRYAICTLTGFEKKSDCRIESDCPYFEECGGCLYRNITYEAELRLKEKQVRDKLIHIAGIRNPEMNSIIYMDEPYRYRNKAGMHISTDGFITEKGGKVKPVSAPKTGFYSRKSHKICNAEDCLLQSTAASAAAAAVRKYMEEDNITSFDARWGKGLMQKMTVKTCFDTGQVMVIFDANGKGFPNAQKLVDYLDEYIYEAGFELESIVLNHTKVAERKNSKTKKRKSGGSRTGKPSERNAGKGSGIDNGGNRLGNTGTVRNNVCEEKYMLTTLQNEYDVIAGSQVIKSSLCGLDFEISPTAFYQVNPVQAEKLYDKAMEYADLRGDELVFDLYCGVGTIGLIAADRMNRVASIPNKGKDSAYQYENTSECADESNIGENSNIVVADSLCTAGKVYGVELDKGAVIDANRNAVINRIVNAEFICGKAEEETDSLLKKGTPDIVFIDPPRSGCDENLLNVIASAAPEKIIYISCDPATLARDIKILQKRGYEFKEATPVDMFPRTSHVETICLMSRVEGK